MPSLRVWPGTPYPLGATWDGEGTHFSLFSEHATGVELCLFDRPADAEESYRIEGDALVIAPTAFVLLAGGAGG